MGAAAYVSSTASKSSAPLAPAGPLSAPSAPAGLPVPRIDPVVTATMRQAQSDLEAGRLEQAKQGFEKALGLLPPNPPRFTFESSAKSRALVGLGDVMVAGYAEVKGNHESADCRSQIFTRVHDATEIYMRAARFSDLDDAQCAYSHTAKSYETAAKLFSQARGDNGAAAHEYQKLAADTYQQAVDLNGTEDGACRLEAEEGFRRLNPSPTD